jgi:hypothetical protein
MEKISAGLITIFSRMRSVQLEGEEEVETIAKMQETFSNATKGVVNIVDQTTGQLRNTYDVLSELNTIWDTLDKNTQEALAQSAAGIRQRSVFLSIMGNWENVEKSVKSATDSLGSADIENQKYLDSISGRMSLLSSEFQKLSALTVDSELVKFFLDLANGVVNLTTAMGGLTPVLTTLAVLYLSFTKKEKFNFLQNFTKMLFNVKDGATAATVSIKGLTISAKALTGLITGGLLIIIPLLVKGFDALITTTKEHAEIISKSTDIYKESASNLENLNSELESTKIRIDELNKLEFPSFTDNLELDKLQKYNAELERSIELEKIQKDASMQAVIADVSDGFKSYQKDFNIDTYKKSIDEIQSYINSANLAMFDADSWASGETLSNYINDKEQQISLYTKDISNLKSHYLEYSKEIEGWINTFEDYGIDKLTPYDKKLYDNLTKELDDLYNTVLSKEEYFNIQIKPKFDLVYNSEDFKKYKEELEKLAVAGKLTPEVLYYNKQYEELLRETGSTALEAATYINTLTNNIDDASVSMSSFPTATFENLNKSLDELESKSKDTVSSIGDLNQILHDQAEGEKLSAEEAYNLIKQFPQLASAIKKTTDGYIINEEAVDNLRLAMIEQEKANATAQLNMTTDTLKGVEDRLDAYGIELEAITDVKSAMAEQSKLSLNDMFGTMEGWAFDDASKRITTSTGSFIADATATEYDSIKKAYEEQKLINDTLGKMGVLKERINGMQGDLITGEDFGVSEGKGKSGSTDPIKEAFDLGIDGIEGKKSLDHRLAMDEITQQQYLDGLEKINEATFGKQKDKYLEQYQQYQEEIYKGIIDIDKQAIEDRFNSIQDRYDLGLLTEEEYYSKLEWLNEKYYKDKEQYAEKYTANLIKLHKWEKEQAEKSREESLKKQADTIDEIIKLYQKARSEIDDIASRHEDGSDGQLTALTNGIKLTSQEIKYLESEIKKLNKLKLEGNFLGDKDDFDNQISVLQDALYDAKNAIIDFQDAISDNIQSTLDDVTEVFEDGYERQTDAIEKERDAYADIIDAQKEILRLKDDERKYEKDIADKTKEISDIESRIAELTKAANSGDREAKAEISKLNEKLADEQEDLAETQHDRGIDLAEDALDKALDDNDKLTQIKLDSAKSEYETRLSNITALFEAEKKLIAEAAKYTREEFERELSSIHGMLAQNGVVLSDQYTNSILSAQSNITAKPQINSIIGTYSEANKSQSTSGLSNLNQNLAGMGYKTINKEQMVQLAQALKLYDIDGVEDIQDTPAGRINKNRILEELKKHLSGSTFTDGGLVGRAINSLGEDGVAILQRDELVFDKIDSKVFREKFIPMMNDFTKQFKFKTPDISNITTNHSPIIQFDNMININGNADASVIPKIKSAGDDIVKKIMEAARIR